MSKTQVMIANMIGQATAMLVSPLFDGGGVKEVYFEGYRKINEIFVDEVLASLIAEQLAKPIDHDILCEELYLLRNLVYRAEHKKKIFNFSGLEYLANLEIIRMSYLENLSTLPDELQKLSNLKVIEFSHGIVEEIPTWVFKLPKLEKLNVSYQKLTNLPLHLSQAKRLRVLNVAGNQLTLLPTEIGTLRHLQVLNVSHNPLSKLPAETVYLTKLNKLDISHTNIAHLSINLAFLEDLEYLNIENTNIKKVDFLLQRRTQDNLRLLGESDDLKVVTYSKSEYADSRKLFPGTMLAMTTFGLLALGMGVNYLKNINTKKGDYQE